MKKIKDLKSNVLKRNFSLAKMAYKVGRDYISEKKDDVLEKGASALSKHSELIYSELAMMKGSALKAGQMLSVYGDYFLPKEVNDVFKKLQTQTHYLDFENISQNIPNHFFDQLKIEHGPFAAASIGQVHVAYTKDQEKMALKIQYPNIKKAINSDMLALKLLLKGIKALPKKFDLDPFLDEVKKMMIHEMDYQKEKQSHDFFIQCLEGDERYYIPKVYDDFCSDTTMATEFIDGVKVDSDVVASLAQDVRNELATSFFELYLREFFEFKKVQSDPHYGNYLLRHIQGRWQWVLLDFGSVKDVSDSIGECYQDMMRACIVGDRELYFEVVERMNYFRAGMSDKDKDLLWDNARLLGDPFKGEIYDWGATRLADDLLKNGMQMFGKVDIASPPQDIVFLDRKIGGVFMILKILGAKIDLRNLALRYLESKNS
ncbi:ABC1 kinase family protein [Bacteriovorax sp. BSW11_IV]|uniref:ABC1 kinase family protein n=1 Tax=Bacteriovorax sp. BSW11_IV TaxID=1353529 RepID=UPI0003FB5A96|nr:AarF/ABC1/UbiB kinase family protein [Bacteriovorax sp. BSW11_IV]